MGFASEPSWGFASSHDFPSGLHTSFLESLPFSFSAEFLIYWRAFSHRDFIGSKIFKPCLYKDIILLFCVMKGLRTHGITGKICLLYPKWQRGHLPLLASSTAALKRFNYLLKIRSRLHLASLTGLGCLAVTFMGSQKIPHMLVPSWNRAMGREHSAMTP